jgi:predicted transcriptional regulator
MDSHPPADTTDVIEEVMDAVTEDSAANIIEASTEVVEAPTEVIDAIIEDSAANIIEASANVNQPLS